MRRYRKLEHARQAAGMQADRTRVMVFTDTKRIVNVCWSLEPKENGR